MFLRFQKVFVAIVVGVLLTSPCLAANKTDATKEIDYSYITAESILAVSLYPNRVLTNPDNKLYPIEVISAAGLQELGIDPVDIESVLVVGEPPAPMPGIGVIVKTKKPYSIKNVLPKMQRMLTDAELDGKSYRKATGPMGLSLYQQDDNTIIVSTEPLLEKLLKTNQAPVDGPLKKQISKNAHASDLLLTVYLDPVKPMLEGPMAMIPIPPEFDDLRMIPELLSFIQIRLALNADFNAKLSMISKNEEDSEMLETLLNKSLAKVRKQFLKEVTTRKTEPVEEAMGKYITRISEYYVNALRPTRNGKELYFEGKGSSISSVSSISLLMSLLLPAVQQAREAARSTQSKNTLKQIGLAFHNYHDVYLKFPARASFDENGKALLSWRVHILPFLDQGALYSEFKLDEPWDSDHNKKLISKMPNVYQNPNIGEVNNKTNYLVPVGKGTPFEDKEGRRIRDLTDGTSNTILVVEADQDQSVIWTKPEDMKYDPAKSLNGLGNFRPNVFQILLADGSVRTININVDKETLKALFTHDGGEVINNF